MTLISLRLCPISPFLKAKDSKKSCQGRLFSVIKGGKINGARIEGEIRKTVLDSRVRGTGKQFLELEKEVRLWFSLRNGA